DQRGGFPDLFDGVVRATQHHIIHLGTIAVGVQAFVDRTPFSRAVAYALDRAVAAVGLLHGHRLGGDADQVVHLDAAGRSRRSAEVLEALQVGHGAQAFHHRNLILHHITDEISQHAPVGGAGYLDIEVDVMGAPAIFVEVIAPVRDAAGEHGRAHAFAPFGIGACAEHAVAIYDRRGFHPGAVLAARGDVAHLVRRAGIHQLHTELTGIGLALLVEGDDFFGQPHTLGLLRIK